MSGMFNPLNNVHNFDLTTSIPDLSGKVIIVTGGNSGVGKESVLQLSKHNPKKLYLAARSKSKFESALADISKVVPNASSNIHYLELDLSSFTSIKAAADKIQEENDRLDILINNAGIMASPPGLTTEGYEVQFGTNHIGTAFLTKLLLPLLLKTASQPKSDVRIVNVSSAAVSLAPRPNGLPFLDSPSRHSEIKTPAGGHKWTYTRYGTSKFANVMHARHLAKLYGDKGITAAAVHPGRVNTNLLNGRFPSIFNPTGMFQAVADVFMGLMTVEQGAMNQLWAATAEKSQVATTNGGFYYPVGLLQDFSKGRESLHDDVARKLWEWQEGEFEIWLKAN